MNEVCHIDMKRKGRIFLAVDEIGNIVRRTYIKGEATPLGNWADKLVDYTDHPDIGLIASSPDLWYKEGDSFKRKSVVKITNKNGGKIAYTGDVVELEVIGVPSEIKEFQVSVGGRIITVVNGEVIEITSAKPARIVVKIIDKRLYQRMTYDLVFNLRNI